MIMENNIKLKYILISLFIFVIIPLFILSLQTLPARTLLKESTSVLVIVGFFFLIGQFYLNRANKFFIKIYKMVKIIKLHKIIGYTVIAIFFIHPFLIVLPRFFEAGVDPIYAFWLMITDFKSLGIIFGLIAWCVMIALLLTSFYKDKLNMTYVKWRVLHIVLSIVFVAAGLWHVIDLGRHMNEFMIFFIFLLVCMAVYLLSKLYFFKNEKVGKVL